MGWVCNLAWFLVAKLSGEFVSYPESIRNLSQTIEILIFHNFGYTVCNFGAFSYCWIFKTDCKL